MLNKKFVFLSYLLILCLGCKSSGIDYDKYHKHTIEHYDEYSSELRLFFLGINENMDINEPLAQKLLNEKRSILREKNCTLKVTEIVIKNLRTKKEYFIRKKNDVNDVLDAIEWHPIKPSTNAKCDFYILLRTNKNEYLLWISDGEWGLGKEPINPKGFINKMLFKKLKDIDSA